MSLTNTSKSMVLSGKHIANINRVLKNIKSDIIADLIKADQQELIIMTNKVVSLLSLSIIENYIKNVDTIDLEDIILP